MRYMRLGLLSIFCIIVQIHSAEKITEVFANTYGKIQNGKVVYFDYYSPDGLASYPAICEYDLQTKTAGVLIPKQNPYPDHIYYGSSGNHVAYVSLKNTTATYYLQSYDLTNGTINRLCEDPSWKESINVGGDKVVWVDYRHVSNIDSINGEIYLHNITDRTTQRITQTQWWESRPATDGNTVVWVSYENGTYGNVYYRDISGGTPQPVSQRSSHQDKPRVYGKYIVWEDFRNAGSDPSNADIYAYDMETDTEMEICVESKFQGNPYIDGSIVVWEDYRNEPGNGINADIYGYDLSTGNEIQVAVESGFQGNPTVNDYSVCWFSMDADSSMWLSMDTIDRSHESGSKGKFLTDRRTDLRSRLSSKELVITGLKPGTNYEVFLYDTRGRLVDRYRNTSKEVASGWVFDRIIPKGKYVISVETSEASFTFNKIIASE